MRIVGLNVASSSGDLNGRAMIDPTTNEFAYLPIPEPMACEPLAPTYRDLRFTDMDKERPNIRAVRFPDAYAHHDLEFDTFTYGHMKRVGDDVLWKLESGDLLLFYSTLDLLTDGKKWGVYIIGYFEVDYVVKVRKQPQKNMPG
jgi:hypothetical protein